MARALAAALLLLTSSCLQPVDEGGPDASSSLDAGLEPELDAGATDASVSADAGEPDVERVLVRGAMITVCDASQNEDYRFALSTTEQPSCDAPLGMPPYRLSLSPPLAVGPMTPPRGELTVEGRAAIYDWSGSLDSVTPWLVTGRIDTFGRYFPARHDRLVVVVCPIRVNCWR